MGSVCCAAVQDPVRVGDHPRGGDGKRYTVSKEPSIKGRANSDAPCKNELMTRNSVVIHEDLDGAIWAEEPTIRV